MWQSILISDEILFILKDSVPVLSLRHIYFGCCGVYLIQLDRLMINKNLCRIDSFSWSLSTIKTKFNARYDRKSPIKRGISANPVLKCTNYVTTGELLHYNDVFIRDCLVEHWISDWSSRKHAIRSDSSRIYDDNIRLHFLSDHVGIKIPEIRLMSAQIIEACVKRLLRVPNNLLHILVRFILVGIHMCFYTFVFLHWCSYFVKLYTNFQFIFNDISALFNLIYIALVN